MSIRLDSSRTVLEPVVEDLGKRVGEWRDMALELKAEAFTEEAKESWE